MLVPAVVDVEYLCIIEAPNGEVDSLVELTYKLCGANCTLRSGVEAQSRGDSAWRRHIGTLRRRHPPAGTKLSTRCILENRLKMRKLTQNEVTAVLEHKHDNLWRCLSPEASKSNQATSKKCARRRGSAPASV